MRQRLTVVLALLLFCANCFAQVSFGQAEKFNDGWEFRLDFEENWADVSLPHDWSVEGTFSPDLASCTGYLPAGIGWYQKVFDGTGLSDAAEVYIYFEGVYNRSGVYLNGQLLGERPSGYASFMYDLTPYLNRDGENVLSVKVNHSRYADSRFYTGSGIYRDVWLIRAGPVHFAQWGVGYNVVSLDEKEAKVVVDMAVEGLREQDMQLKVVMRDDDGTLAASGMVKAADTAQVELKLENPRFWNLNEPYLYSIEAQILSKEEVVDETDFKAGLRSLQFDPDKGFALNGEWMKVKGVCLHHDAGVLGAAVPREVWERRFKNLKEIGVNAIRTSHNPQAPCFYDLCDELGLLVMDEAFDEWEFPKRKWVEGWNVGTPAFDGAYDFFEEWGERDLADMVRRDRNHPCIFMWSIGNEVDYPNDPYSHPVLDGGNADFSQPAYGGFHPEAPDAMRLGQIAERLSAVVRSVDTSRPVTGALAGVVMSNQTAYPDALDVVGYNYTEIRYQIDHENYPDRVIYGSENGHGYENWLAVKENPHIFGQFLWTGLDYLGESGPWPSRGSEAGLLDFGGFLKPQGAFRASLWSEKPVCYLYTGRGNEALPSWNFDYGQTVHVTCYTNADSAELLLNGEKVGERRTHDSRGRISWDIPFEAGVLKAVGFDGEQKEVSSAEIKTSLRPYRLSASAENLELKGRGTVAHVVVEILDDNGNPVPLADNEIKCNVEGAGELLGLEGCNNTDMGNYRDNIQRAYRGRLLAYIRSTEDSGEITVNFSSPLLIGDGVKIKVNR